MATEAVKAWTSRYFGVLQRSLYVACTALALQLVMRYWEATPRGPVLWEARAEPWATWVPLLCFVLHVVSWLLIFSILLVFDYAELMGLKQVRLPHPHLRPVPASLSLLYSSDFSWLSSPLPSCMIVFLQPAFKGQ